MGRRPPVAEDHRRRVAACADPAGVTELRHGALERAGLLLADWRDTQARLGVAEQRMVTVLGELGLTGLVTSITGLSAVGAACVLAETGDPSRFTSGRALVKHAGLAPRQKSSGSYTGRTRMTGQGRPGLRRAAWRAVWGALKSNPVYAARFAHPTGREHKAVHRAGTRRTRRGVAASPARRYHYRPAMGPGHRGRRQTGPDTERRLTPGHRQPPQAGGRGEPHAASRRVHRDLACHPGQPARRRTNPIKRCRAPSPLQLRRDQRRSRAPAKPLTKNALR